MSAHPISIPGSSGLIVEESSPDCLRVRTSPIGAGLRNFALAAYFVLMGWIIWSTGGKLVALMHRAATPLTKGQTAAASPGSGEEWFSIFMGLGVSTLFVSAICWGVLWLACGYQRLHVQGGILDYESRLGPHRLAQRGCRLAEITA